MGRESCGLFIGLGVISEPVIALKYFNRVIKQKTHLAKAYYHHGTVHVMLGQTDDARKDFATFLELDPEGAHAAEAKGILQILE